MPSSAIPGIRILKKDDPERWQMGPVAGVDPILQPVLHALLQARDEINTCMENVNTGALWSKPSGVAAVAFHLQHIRGVLDRLFAYAAGNALSQQQLQELSEEGVFNAQISTETLLTALNNQFEKSFAILQTVPASSLTEIRFVGRKKIPSTAIGLYFHAAEHTMRHLGQLLVTLRVV